MNSEEVVEKSTKANGELKEIIAREENVSVIDYIRNLSGGAAMQVKIARNSPKVWRGVNVGGHLDTLTDFITEDEIKERYGGGNFTIQVSKQRTEGKGAGRFEIVGQRKFDIAGNPIISEQDHVLPPVATITAPAEDSSLSKHAMSLVERQLAEAEKRAAAAEQRYLDGVNAPKGHDPMITVLLAQLEQQNRQMEQLRNQLMDAQKSPPTVANPVQDKLLEKLLMDDTVRVDSMRTTHAAELRQLQSHHVEDVKRIEDRYERIRADEKRSHDRELDNTKAMLMLQLENTRGAYEARISGLQEESKRLVKQLDEARDEIKELRRVKEKPVVEQLTEIMTLKDALTSLSDKEEPEESTFDKLVKGAPAIIEGIAGRMGAAAQEKQAAALQVQQAQQLALQQKIARKKAAQAAKPKIVAEDGTVLPDFNPMEVKMAVEYLENAVSRDQDPAVVAQSVRALIPVSIVSAISKVGVDKWLDSVAQLQQSSPLNDMKGRTFVREVAKALLS